MNFRAALAVVFVLGCGGNHIGFGSDAGDDGTVADGGGGIDSPFGLPDTSTEGGGCTGLQCQIKNCGGGVSTTISGTVFAPNGTLPLYNVIVYVPNSALDPIQHGVTCDQCGAAVSGNPIAVASTDATGHFQIKNAPNGTNIPLVMQVGKWRRQVNIANVNACVDNPVGQQIGGVEQMTRLPKNQTEGDMPHVAITTGYCETFACIMPKLGIDATEYAAGPTSPSVKPTKAFSFYLGQGFLKGGGPSGSPNASVLWNDANMLKNFDMAMFSCECSEPPDANTVSYSAVRSYLDAGGRIFSTDFMYVWYKDSPDTNLNVSPWSWPGGAPAGDDPVNIDTSFPKGQAFADWMYNISTLATYGPNFHKPVTKAVFYVAAEGGYVFDNIYSIDTKYGLEWSHSLSPQTSTQHPRVVTMGMPSAQPPAMQCGKGVHLDFHVDQQYDKVDSTYPAGCSSTMREPELSTIFFFFDIASCIQDDTMPIILPK
jgi:hypothetical protein